MSDLNVLKNESTAFGQPVVPERVHDQVIEELSTLIDDYLIKHPRLSLNALSKRCRVSEPTIRRISKRQVKTVPNVSTVLDILTTLFQTTDVSIVIEKCGGAIASYVKESLPHLAEQEIEYSGAINSQLQEPNKYLIFKLALNRNGLSHSKLISLFGEVGTHEVRSLLKHGILDFDGEVYRAKIKGFQGHRDDFVDHFKAVANFIKPHKVRSGEKLNPLFLNGSESVSPKAYQEIVKVQRAAFKKISHIISSDESAGDIPLFYLCALDTLDVAAAFEFASEPENQ